jgi:hypothetical protein
MLKFWCMPATNSTPSCLLGCRPEWTSPWPLMQIRKSHTRIFLTWRSPNRGTAQPNRFWDKEASRPDRSLLKPTPLGRSWHFVCVTRAPWSGQHGFYMLPLRERLPAIRVPHRRSDPDAALDLQALINLDYATPPQPPLPNEELDWVKQVLGGQMG